MLYFIRWLKCKESELTTLYVQHFVYFQETLIEYCLQALLSHSTVEEQCSVLMESMTLPLFSLIIAAHPDNARIKSLIGKILSNISLHPRHHRAIFR